LLVRRLAFFGSFRHRLCIAAFSFAGLLCLKLFHCWLSSSSSSPLLVQALRLILACRVEVSIDFQ